MAVQVPALRLPSVRGVLPKLSWLAADVVDPRTQLAQPDPVRFAALMVELGAIIFAFAALHVEQPQLLTMLGIVSVGFGIHYWLPFRFKEPFLIAVSIASAFVLLDARVAALVLATGVVLFAIISAPVHYLARVALVAGVGMVLTIGRTLEASPMGIPSAFWPVVGSIFMFRLVVYLYDLRHAARGASLREYLSYFFLIPNYYFLLFPVVDFQTMRKSYFQRDIHQVAQVGIKWIARGLVQLLFYRIIFQYRLPWQADVSMTPPVVIREMVLLYLLYLRVSGTFHIIVGVLHLFGYNLPETHRRYLLASSISGFWRRINIYWKDFMVKLVYFPAYFRLRKMGELRAQVIATLLVFATTWLLHSYQFFWLSGRFPISAPDIAFWSILGALVVANLLWDTRRKRTRPAAASPGARAKMVAQIAGTFVLITLLWSVWNSSSLEDWLEIVAFWQPPDG